MITSPLHAEGAEMKGKLQNRSVGLSQQHAVEMQSIQTKMPSLEKPSSEKWVMSRSKMGLFLAAIGVRNFKHPKACVYQWILWTILAIAFAYTIVIKYVIQIVFEYPYGLVTSCASTLEISDEGIPCLFVVCINFLSLVYGSTSLALYVWIVRYGFNPEALKHDHMERLKPKLDLKTRRMVIIFTSQTFLTTIASTLKDTQEPTSVPTFWRIAGSLFTYGIVNVAGAGQYAAALMIYSETRYLRNILKDFVERLHAKPFVFSSVTRAHKDLIIQFEIAQSRFGYNLGVGMVGCLLICISFGVQWYYMVPMFVRFMRLYSRFYAGLYLFTMIIYTVSYMYPIYVIVSGLVRLNDHAEKLAEECVSFLASFSGFDNLNLRSSTLLRLLTACSESDPIALNDEPVYIQHAVEDQLAMTRASLMLNDAMRLKVIIESRPVSLLIIDYRPRTEHIRSLLVAGVCFSAIEWLGLSDYAG